LAYFLLNHRVYSTSIYHIVNITFPNNIVMELMLMIYSVISTKAKSSCVNYPSIHITIGSAPVGVQCPISSSLGEFPGYWDWLWCPGLSPVLVYFPRVLVRILGGFLKNNI